MSYTFHNFAGHNSSMFQSESGLNVTTFSCSHFPQVDLRAKSNGNVCAPITEISSVLYLYKGWANIHPTPLAP
jgi:hypothetical protein